MPHPSIHGGSCNQMVWKDRRMVNGWNGNRLTLAIAYAISRGQKQRKVNRPRRHIDKETGIMK